MAFRAGASLAAGLRAWGGELVAMIAVAAVCWAPVATVLPLMVGRDPAASIGMPFLCLSGLVYFAPAFLSFLVVSATLHHQRDTQWMWIGIGLFAHLLQFVAMGAIASRLAGGAASWAGAVTRSLVRTASYAALLAGGVVLVGAATVSVSLAIGLIRPMSPLGLVWGLPVALLLGIYAARYWVALPAMSVEGVGFWGAAARSRNLTEGNRARVFGILLVVNAPPFGLALLVAGAFDHVASETAVTAAAFIYLGAGLLLGPLKGAVLAETYEHLREAREGMSDQDLRKVFE